MNDREQLLARIKGAKLGFEHACNESEKKLWLAIHNKLTMKYNRMRAERAGTKLKVDARKL